MANPSLCAFSIPGALQTILTSRALSSTRKTSQGPGSGTTTSTATEHGAAVQLPPDKETTEGSQEFPPSAKSS